MNNIFSTSNVSLVTKYFSSKSTASSSLARQGIYTGQASSSVGIIRFPELTSVEWWKIRIKRVKFHLKHGSSGRYDGSDKTFYFWTSAFQVNNDTSVTGAEFVADQLFLGGIVKACRRDTVVTFDFPEDGDVSFRRIVSYLQQGNDTFLLYTDEKLSGSYSPNYLSVTEATLEIEYDDDALVYVGDHGEWVRCQMYYGTGGEWVPVVPYIGDAGEWRPVGT